MMKFSQSSNSAARKGGMRKYKIIYSIGAANDLDNIYDYIFDILENPSGADKTIKTIETRCANLSIFPRGVPVSLVRNGKELRFAHAKKYTIIYYIDDSTLTVVIYAILYSRRNITHILNDR